MATRRKQASRERQRQQRVRGDRYTLYPSGRRNLEEDRAFLEAEAESLACDDNKIRMSAVRASALLAVIVLLQCVGGIWLQDAWEAYRSHVVTLCSLLAISAPKLTYTAAHAIEFFAGKFSFVKL